MIPSILLAGETGRLTREIWFGIPGERVSAIAGSARFYDLPDLRDTISGSESLADIGDDYGQRLRGYITAPVTGDYTFWIAGDNNCSLFLSTGESKFDKQRIAFIDGAGAEFFVGPRDWDYLPSQQSQIIHLVAGQKYFVELLHKEFWGGDHLSMAWQIPGGSRELVPGLALESFTVDPDDLDGDELSDAWETTHHFSLTDNGTLHPEQHPLADPDHDGISNLQESLANTDPNPPAGTASGLPGRFTREVWLNLSGTRISDLTTSPRYWQIADSVSTFAGASAPENIAEDYASRMRGYITAPVTGLYTFWVASDDASELYLSTDGSKFNRSRIASLASWTAPRDWEATPSQKSAAISLVAGQRYFIETLHKDGQFGDHLEIAWQIPGGSRELIPPYALESYTVDPNDLDQDELPDTWEAAYGFSASSDDPEQHPLADPDRDGYSNLEESQFDTDPFVRGGVPGTLLLETWFNLPGETINDLTFRRRFYTAPDQSAFVYSAETPPNRADDYGARMRGYVIPPVSGDYIFYLSGDDACELWLSSGESQFSKQKIAWQESWAPYFDWAKFGSQKSNVIPLEAGQKYYIEALLKEGIFGDHLEIGWVLPGSGDIVVIPGANLESYAYDAQDPDGDNMPLHWEQSHGLDPAVNDAEQDPDYDGIPNALEYENRTNPQVKNGIEGALLHELWWNVPAFSVRSAIAVQRMLQPPDEHTLALTTEGHFNYGEAYADRYRGYITAPVSGAYTFWADGDEEVEVWLSTSEDKFEKQLIVHPGPQIKDWDADLSMKSRAITLEAGQRYYLEILHVNHHGGDYCDVAWQVPGRLREIIPGGALTSYSPVPNDQDDDNLPDDWEIANNLDLNDNGSIDPKNGAHGDLDGDGLDNAAEWRANTRADLFDTDGDGVNDRDEVDLIETNALLSDVAAFQSVATIPGSAFTSTSGTWIKEGTKARQDCLRGWLEYTVSLASAGVYQLDLAFTPTASATTFPDFEIVFSADGKTIQRVTATAASNGSGHARILSPWLAAGDHTIRVFVDNARRYRRVTVDQMDVLETRGTDQNANGTPDWVEHRIAKFNRFEAPEQSITSPVCLEGKAKWSELTIVAGAGVQMAPNDRWYANVPLDAEQPTSVMASLENGAIQATRQIAWTSVNLLECGDLTIRQGDSLKLSAYKNSPNSNKPFTLIMGEQSYTVSGQNPLVMLFDAPGSFPIHVSGAGNGAAASLNVNVVGSQVIESPVCDVGSFREVNIPSMVGGVSVHLDERIEIRETITNADGSKRHVLRLNTLDDRLAILRLGDAGPVLGATRFRAMRIRNGGIYFGDALGADTWEVIMPCVLDGACSDVFLEYNIFTSGVTFDDGSIHKILNWPSDITKSGEFELIFYKNSSSGSNCHRVSAWQGPVRIAFYQ